jgi:hypothetical protein
MNTPLTTLDQDKLTRPPGIQEPHRENNEKCGKENGVKLHGDCDE